MSTRDDTVQQLYDVANQDVEMQDSAQHQHLQCLYIVIDTNILIDYCSIIEQFCLDVEARNLPIKVVVPSVVLGELDGLKNRPELQWFARTASTWLLNKVKERKTVRVQAMKETKAVDVLGLGRNDLAVRDCCLFFVDESARTYPSLPVLLVCMDTNLCLACEKEEGIVTYSPPKRSWSSRMLAQALPVANVPPGFLSWFHGHELFPKYRPSRAKARVRLGQTEIPQRDDDMMDIDTGDSEEHLVPSHALDSLHMQMIDHFPLVMKELVARVMQVSGEAASFRPSDSRHAPGWRRKELALWTVPDCLDYLRTKGKVKHYHDKIGRFFLVRNQTGWRRGQDWERSTWDMVLQMLEEVGKEFADGALMSSVAAVSPHVREVWEAKLRPT